MKKIIVFLLIAATLLSSLSTGAFATEGYSTEPKCDAYECWFNDLETYENGVFQFAVSELPEDAEAYCYTCNVCKNQFASDYERTPNSDGTFGSCYVKDCNGKYTGPTPCAKEYFYKFDCSECKFTKEYNELPAVAEDETYGKCPSCNATATEEMFKIRSRYRQYKQPCFYCYKVQLGGKSIYDNPNCPYCGECYDMVPPDSVDADGNLIYGGGGDNLYYCKETQKFYIAPEDENGFTIEDCPYCDSNITYKITVLYCTTCPSCGTRAERAHLDYYKRPYLAGTINNAFMSIAVDITGNIDPNDFDLTNTCYECKYNFTKDENILITRHIDAPKDAKYESHPNDRDYHETDEYIESGSMYDNFFERIIYAFRRIKYIIDMYIEMIFSGELV